MAEIKFTTFCQGCEGTGIRRYNAFPDGPLVEENPCSKCGGDGVRTLFKGVESSLFDDILDKLGDIKEQCDSIMEQLKEQ